MVCGRAVLPAVNVCWRGETLLPALASLPAIGVPIPSGAVGGSRGSLKPVKSLNIFL